MSAKGPPDSDQITKEAVMAVLEPLAGLLMSRQVRYAGAEDLLKTAYLVSCARAYADQGKAVTVSALSVATGIRRREVKRLLEGAPENVVPPVSPASQIRLRWSTDPLFLDGAGQPRRLPRTAPDDTPSFAQLASLVSRDIHPRALLTELVRIGAVEEDGEFVTLLQRRFQPTAHQDERTRIAGANVGDHLSSALLNLLTDPPPLPERAIIADGLTQASALRANEMAAELWDQYRVSLREKLQTLVDLDKEAPHNDWRVRIGMYGYLAPQAREKPTLGTTRQRASDKSKRKAPK